MSSNSVPMADQIKHAKHKADQKCSEARMEFRIWLDCHRRLFLLKQCERYQFFANNPLQLNVLMLRDLRCKPLRACLQEVLRLQRGMVKSERRMKAAYKYEKEYNAEYWRLSCDAEYLELKAMLEIE